MPNTFDANDGESDSDDENSPTPMLTTNDGPDDDEPPAAGAVTIQDTNNPDAWISFAPKGEPQHRAKPEKVVTA